MPNKLRQLFWSSRPVSWVNTAYPFAAGYLLGTGHVDTTFIVGTIYFLIPYNLMMYGINDVFDYQSDLLNKRKGGVEGAKLAKSQHRFIIASATIINIPFIIALALLSNTFYSYLMLLALIFLVLGYSLPKLRFKERPFIDSMTSSSHFVGPLIYGLSFSGYSHTGIIVIISFFLWGMASHAFGAVQDIIADRAGGIGSIATVIGAKSTVRLSALLYFLSGLLLISVGGVAILAGLINLLYIANIITFINIGEAESESANAGWRRFLKLNFFSGFLVTMILIYVFRTH